MTYLEKYKQDHPYKTLNRNGLPGGDLCDCPSDHCYEDADAYIYGGCCHQDLDCRTCWNREMPEEDGGENMDKWPESEPIKCNDACENITPELVADLRTKLRELGSENATLKECIIRMTLQMVGLR